MNSNDTLLMSFTNFEMKCNLFIKEPILIKNWIRENIYEIIYKNNLKNNEAFIIYDDPP